MNKVTDIVNKLDLELRQVQRVIVLNNVIGGNEEIQQHFPMAASLGIIKQDVLEEYSDIFNAVINEIGDSEGFPVSDFLGDADEDERLLMLNEAIVALAPKHCDLGQHVFSNLDEIIGATVKEALMQFVSESGGIDKVLADILEEE